MSANAKRHFLDCRSLAEMAMTLVLVGVMAAFPLLLLTSLLIFMFELPVKIVIGGSMALWIAFVVMMALRFVRIARGWPEPRLGAREFFYFQVAAAGFVLTLSVVFPWSESLPAINGVRWFLAALLIMANVAYMTFAIAIKARVPKQIVSGFVANFLVMLLPFWFT